MSQGFFWKKIVWKSLGAVAKSAPQIYHWSHDTKTKCKRLSGWALKTFKYYCSGIFRG